ncbi:hypothetical protein HID58_094869, partial [Brassica napus]
SISSTKKDDPDEAYSETFNKDWRVLEIAQFQEFQSILRENPAQEFEIVIGIHVSNKFFLSLARPTIGSVPSKATWTQLPEWEVQICRLLQYCGIISKFAEFEKASDKLGFN